MVLRMTPALGFLCAERRSGRRAALLAWGPGCLAAREKCRWAAWWLLLALAASLVSGPALAARDAQDEAMAAMQARAEAVFARLAEALAPEYDIAGQFSIQVVRERVPNAWINQDNEIFVTTGLMELLATDDQLAGVIGHEIAHGTLGHIPQRINHSLWSAFLVLALGVVASSRGDADWDGLLQMRDLFMYAYSREQESEADLTGLRYARAAGYDPEGLVQALQLMDQERRALPEDSIWRELYRTHPPIPQRVSDLRFYLTTERLSRAPLTPASLAVRQGAASAQDAAVEFARALLSGGWDVAALLTAPDAAEAVAPTARWDELAGYFDQGWAFAAAEVVERRRAEGQRLSLDETLVVRLTRPQEAGDEPAGGETVDVAVTVRRSAAGWFVVGWQLPALGS